ncbi:MAG: manganese efflux pump MntP family protein [Gracilibacteraceae bacterium]|jgi:putative Mn2+ efflux pump MntP|nr:manganese efflux pump MntP family protein [Gracilibacteraceae bacterium]
MSLPVLFLTAAALSMDAFAVAVCKGLSMDRADWKKSGIVGAYFGLFQALMPLTGFLLGTRFAARIKAVDHWAVFLLLGIIGGKMIKESREYYINPPGNGEAVNAGVMLPLAVATSIDALAAGLTFSLLHVHIVPAALLIGAVTFTVSALGVRIGGWFGGRFHTKAELAGGIVLIAIGLKILLEHLMWI